MDATPTELDCGPLDLLVIQPTPFCNIDCSYCYLPDRQSKKQISRDVLEAIFERVFASGLVERHFTIVWHAGEPCVLPPRFYEEAFAILARHNRAGVHVEHSFQTNGTLIDADWCAFIKANDVRIGVSVDGPAFLHDRYRRTRRGKGTHARVVEGMKLLRSEGIPFHVITVLTGESLDYPDELYEFYRQQGISSVGFNVEEIEGPHQHSSLEGSATYERVVRFFNRFFDLAKGESPLHVRELEGALGTIFGASDALSIRSHEIMPLAIISVDCEGRFSSFSPELLGLKSEQYGDFEFGRVQSDRIQDVAGTTKFRAIRADIDAGVEKCRQNCPYFKYCGGGAPVNKYFENGSFDSMETMFCRLSKQAVLDAVLSKLENDADANRFPIVMRSPN
jgi:uncharacterized protein